MRLLHSLPWVGLCTPCTYLYTSPPLPTLHTHLSFSHFPHAFHLIISTTPLPPHTHIHLRFSHSVISCCNSAFLSLTVAKAVSQTQLSASMTSSLGLSWEQRSANLSTWSCIHARPHIGAHHFNLREEKGKEKKKELNRVGQY